MDKAAVVDPLVGQIGAEEVVRRRQAVREAVAVAQNPALVS